MDHSLLHRTCRPDDLTARCEAARAFICIFPDLHQENEFTHARHYLLKDLDELQRLASVPGEGTLKVSIGVNPESGSSGSTDQEDRFRDDRLYFLNTVLRTRLVPDREGFEARAYLAKLWVEILAMSTPGSEPKGLKEFSSSFRQILLDLHAGNQKRSPLDPPASLLGLWKTLNLETQDSNVFPNYFWTAWRTHLSDQTRQAIFSPFQTTNSLDEESDGEAGTIITSSEDSLSDVDEERPFGWLPGQSNEISVLANSPGSRETYERSTLSTITPVLILSESSASVLRDDEMTVEITRLIKEANEAIDLGEFDKAEFLSSRCLIPTTVTRGEHVGQIVWGDSAFPTTQTGCISLDAQWFFRPEISPGNPDLESSRSFLPLPLPITLSKLLLRLNPCPKAGEKVLRSARLTTATKHDGPADTTFWRTVLSRLACEEPLGLTGAQWASGDSLGISLAPLHYDQLYADRFAQIFERIVFPWFGEKPGKPRKWRPDPLHILGSKVRPALSELIKLNAAIRERRPDIADGLVERLDRRSRNQVHGLAHFAAHRPSEGFLSLTIHNFSFTNLVAVISDKAVSPDWQVRPIAVPEIWQRELIALIGDLQEATVRFPDTTLGIAAQAALDGSGPLFLAISSPDNVSAFSLSDYKASLPASLLKIPNFARHALNTYLIGRVPESIRVAQLGWHGTREGAWADGSPWSALSIATILAPRLTEHLKNVGWRPLRESNASTIKLPSPKVDWIKLENDHQRSFQKHVTRLKQAMAKRHAEIALPMRAFIRQFLSIRLPTLTLDDHGGFKHVAEIPSQPVNIDDKLLDELEICLAGGNPRSVQGAVGRNLVSALMRGARARGIVEGRIPRRVIWHFPRRAGLFMTKQPAAMHACQELDEWLVDSGKMLSEAAIAVIALILHSGYADASTALCALSPKASYRRTRSHPDLLLVGIPDSEETGEDGSRAGPTLAFHGLAAVHLMRWKSKSDGKSILAEELNNEIYRLLPENLRPATQSMTLEYLAALARARRGLTMDGTARLIGVGTIRHQTIGVDQLVENYDESGVGPRADLPLLSTEIRPTEKVSRRDKDLNALYALMTEALHNSSKANIGKTTARVTLISSLTTWCAEAPAPLRTVDLLARYALRLLQRGGERQSHLQLQTIRGYLHSIAAPLIANLENPLKASDNEWSNSFIRILSGTAPSFRADRFSALRRFHTLLSNDFTIPEVDFNKFSSLVGRRGDVADAGLVTDAEMNALCSMLSKDIADLDAAGALPDDLHLANARLVAALAMRSSGLRTGEVHGLRNKDVDFSGENVSVIVRGSLFQNLKTTRSRRRSAFCGRFAARAAISIRNWIEERKSRDGTEPETAKALFHALSATTNRLPRQDIFGRISELLRWATGLAGARTYWLRKTSACERLIQLMHSESTSLWGLRAYLAQNGHGLLTTTLAHYIHDPITPMIRWFKSETENWNAKRLAFAADLSESRIARNHDSANKSAHLKKLDRIAYLLGRTPFSQEPNGFVAFPSTNKPTIGFRPDMREVERVLQRVASGSDPIVAGQLDRWPEKAAQRFAELLNHLQTNFRINISEKAVGNEVIVSPPRALSRTKQVLDMMDFPSMHFPLIEMSKRWIDLAGAGLPRGIPGTHADWTEWEKRLPILTEGDWVMERRGAIVVRAPATGERGVGTLQSLIWVMVIAWLMDGFKDR